MTQTPSLSEPTKRCRGACGQDRPADYFYAHDSKCKACRCALVRAYRSANIEGVRAYDRERYKQPARKAYTDGRANGYIATHPKARAAHSAIRNAVRDGRATRKPCEVCGKTANVHAHHDDYDKPLDVRWLCVPHHAAWHIDNGPGKNLG